MQNKDEKTIAALLSLGLSEKEVNVYLTTLELGRATVSSISRKAGINRTTGYSILDSLSAKGLVSISGKEPKEEYVAESPDRLLDFLNQQKQVAEKMIRGTDENMRKVEALLPQLKSFHKVGDRPQVRFYEGKEGLRYVYEDTLTSTDGIRAFATFEDMAASLGNYYTTYIKKRAAKGIFSRGIVPRTPEAIERKKRDKEEYRELLLLPEDKPSIFPEIDIYGNKVMIASEREKLGIIIESEGIATAMKKIFELAWQEALRLDKEAALGERKEAGV